MHVLPIGLPALLPGMIATEAAKLKLRLPTPPAARAALPGIGQSPEPPSGGTGDAGNSGGAGRPAADGGEQDDGGFAE